MITKKEKRKEQLTETIMSYVEDNKINLSLLRTEFPKEYGKIPYYFGSIVKMIEELGLNNAVTKRSERSINEKSVRNKLARDYLEYLMREKNMSMQDIGDMYSCTRMNISNLYKTLCEPYNASHPEVNVDITPQEINN